jgi:hypothetical protein
MKLEKREITLNEADSLTDVFFTEKSLASHYVFALESVKRKQTRLALLSLLKQVGEDLYFARDLMEKALEEQSSFNGEN